MSKTIISWGDQYRTEQITNVLTTLPLLIHICSHQITLTRRTDLTWSDPSRPSIKCSALPWPRLCIVMNLPDLTWPTYLPTCLPALELWPISFPDDTLPPTHIIMTSSCDLITLNYISHQQQFSLIRFQNSSHLPPCHLTSFYLT